MIKLYGGKMDRGGRCILALEECGVDYELDDIRGRGEHKSSEYLKLNPNGTVPTLVDGETVVWESMAINLYLAEAYGNGLMPADPASRGQVYQWSLWAITSLEPKLITIFANRMMLPEDERDPRAADAAANEAKELLKILDHGLEGQSQLVGATFTIADVNVGHVVGWARMVGIDLGETPNVARWFAVLRERPSFKKLIA